MTTLALEALRRAKAEKPVVFAASPRPFGEAGRLIVRSAQQAISQWNDQRSATIAQSMATADDFVGPPPPRQSTAVRLRYTYRGRGKPLPYPIDDE
jgi:hypothetical protein